VIQERGFEAATMAEIRVEPKAGSSDRREGLLAGGVNLDFIATNLGKRERGPLLDRCDRALLGRLPSPRRAIAPISYMSVRRQALSQRTSVERAHLRIYDEYRFLIC